MDILSGISSPFELRGERQGLRFSGGDQDGQFEVKMGNGSSTTCVQGSWDYRAQSGASNFYYDLTVMDNDSESKLALRLSRDESGQGRLHITTPQSATNIEVSAPLGDLSRANSNVFDDSFLDYPSIRDVSVETYEDGIAVSIYRDGESSEPVRYLVNEGQVCLECH